jgi:biopolymer transport protein ExbD
MPQTNVNLIPMIDVVFQLVIFFMVSTTFIVNPGIPLVLPGSTTAEPVVMTKLVVTVISRDDIYLNKAHYNLEGLSTGLREISPEERDHIKTVVIEADRTVSYELMIQVLDILRKQGFKGVNLKTRQIE